MTDALGVAAYLKSKDLYGRTHLQKLLYYSQGWSLAWTGKPLFRESFLAYQGGPVVYSVWKADEAGSLAASDMGLSSDQRSIIDAVFDFYGHLGGKRLSDQTHLERPWLDARGGIPASAPSNVPLSDRTIVETFTEMATGGSPAPVRPHLTSNPAARRAVDIRTRALSRKWAETLAVLADR